MRRWSAILACTAAQFPPGILSFLSSDLGFWSLPLISPTEKVCVTVQVVCVFKSKSCVCFSPGVLDGRVVFRSTGGVVFRSVPFQVSGVVPGVRCCSRCCFRC